MMLNAKNKRYIATFGSLSVIMTTSLSIADDLLSFKPSTTPLIKIATPKPNIYMLLDDSYSMHIQNGVDALISAKEDFFGPGDPVCVYPKEQKYQTAWKELVKKYKEIEKETGSKYYDPFNGGTTYKSWHKLTEEEKEKYVGSIPVERCANIYRTEAVMEMAPQILERYSKSANLGYGGLGKGDMSWFRRGGFNILGSTSKDDGICVDENCSPYYGELFLAKLRWAEKNNLNYTFNQIKAIDDSKVQDDIRYNVFEQPITDMSEYTADDWKDVRRSIARNIMGEYTNQSNNKRYILGGTPTFSAIYNVALYFRGYPIINRGFNGVDYIMGSGSYYTQPINEDFTKNSENDRSYTYSNQKKSIPKAAIDWDWTNDKIIRTFGTTETKDPTTVIKPDSKDILMPKRFRCTTNTVVVLTDGKANENYLGVIAEKDLVKNGGYLPGSQSDLSNWGLNLAKLDSENNATITNQSLYNMSKLQELQFKRAGDGTFHFLGRTARADYRLVTVDKSPVHHDGMMERLSKTIAREFTQDTMRKGYHDKDPAGVKWDSDIFSKPQKLQVSVVQYGTTDDNKYLEKLVEMTEGKMIVLPEDASSYAIYNAMDNIMSDLIRSTSNAQVATSQLRHTPYSMRYTFKYSIDARSSEILAHNADKTITTGWAEDPVWSSTASINTANGNFITMNYNSNKPVPAEVNMDNIRSAYIRAKPDTTYLDANHIAWIKGIEVRDDVNKDERTRVYHKVSPIGPIINSESAMFAHDVEYINLKYIGENLKKEFNEYVLHKNTKLKKDYMVINANDGMIHFIDTPRSSDTIKEDLKSGKKSVERIAAYFPGILAYRLSELSNQQKFEYSIDGFIRLFEFKDSQGDIRTIGLSGFGAGGKGLVGYQLFKATPQHSNAGAVTFSSSDNDRKITPLFEISNEEKWSNYGNNSNFGNLGYTFSDFGFVNKKNPETSYGQGVAVFGNGYGAAKNNFNSSLYFIDVETGKFLKEIILDKKGGGASSPALIVEGSGDYQTLKKIYVGDASGKLYRITFTDDDLSHNPVEILYEPANGKYNPISTKPLVSHDGVSSDEWVYFGTGRKSDLDLDRKSKSNISSPSKDTQYIIALRNPQRIGNQAITTAQLHPNKIGALGNKLTINIGGTTAKPETKEIRPLSIESASSNKDKLTVGWYLPLNQSMEINTALKTGGERIVFPAKQSYSDILFSTWGLDEYDSDIDPCTEDTAYGKVLILDKETGLTGSGAMGSNKIGGFIVDEQTPGGPSYGNGITAGSLSGEAYGATTLDKDTVDKIRKSNEDSSYPLISGADICEGNVADDLPNVYGFTVACPPIKNTTNRRLSIRKKL